MSAKNGKEPINKDGLRKKIAAARDALSPQEVTAFSGLIRARLFEIPEARAASTLFIYVSHRNEVDTHELIRTFLRQGKTIAVPLITGEGVMEAHRIGSLDDLSPGKFGILAPRKGDLWTGPLDLAMVPGVAFTARGDRLGRGKGYYDRFLAARPGFFAVGLGYELQVVEEIPVIPTDHRLDLIITEMRTIRISKEARK